VTIKLPRRMYVADVRSGKQFGNTDVVHTSILIGDALVLGLTSEPNGIRMEGAATAQRGDHISLKVASTTPGTSLVRCHVFLPDGSRSPIYSRNVLVQNGAGAFILPFALNDLPGKYVIRSTDVMTGAAFEKAVDLR